MSEQVADREVEQVNIPQEELTDITLTPEEQLEEFSDNIIGAIIRNSETSLMNRKYLFGQLDPISFKDENHIIYKVFYKFKEVGITPDVQFMQYHLTLNEGVINTSRNNINLSAFAGLDESPVVSYISAVIKKFTRLLQFEDITLDAFKLLIEKYKALHQVIELDNALTQAKSILHDGLKLGRNTLQGYLDSAGYIKSSISQLDSEMDKSAGLGFIDASTWDDTEDEKNLPVKIGDFGDIDELNKLYGGIFTSLFYSVVAPTKTGKSKFTSKMVHNCILQGTNVSVWAVEGGFKAWLAQLRAIHFNWYYNRNKPIDQRINGVDQDAIMFHKFPDERTAELEQISKQDLFGNANYGRVNIIDRPFLLETFIDEIETSVQLNHSQMVLVDYMQLIGSKLVANVSDRVSQAYIEILKYIKKRNVAFVSPAQFKQDFIDEASKSKDLSKLELRISGGESSQIIRTPDINIALYGSDEDIRNKKLTLLSIPSRFSCSFAPFEIYAHLGTCEFSSILKDVA